jgi:hypothetical protein
VLLTYKKVPAIDLTQRIKQFITPSGIDVENVEVPPGTHSIRVDVKDNEGRAGWKDFTFQVIK